MKNHIIISLLILSVGLSQQLIPQITETYKNGNIKSITYHKKTRDGIQKVKEEGYHVKGYKNFEGTYKGVDYRGRPKKDGLWTEWWSKGQKSSEETYKDGKRDGLSTVWYPNGQKETEETYKDGNYNGRTDWWENGQKKFEITYKDDELISEEKRWNKDGSVRE